MKFLRTAAYVLTLLMLTAFGEDAGGSLTGQVIYNGPVPAPKMTPVPPAAIAQCKCPAVADESLVVDPATKGLKWAIIRIQDVTPKDVPPKPAKPYSIDQNGCTFTPHVVVVPPNTDLEILNPAKIAHNIHTTPYDSADPAQNQAALGDLTYKAKWLKDPDIIEIKCDIHSWMKGFIVCHDPRYCAISGTDGKFEIKNLPAGKYKVNIFHESFGNYMKKDTIDVEVKAGAPTNMGELKFEPKK